MDLTPLAILGLVPRRPQALWVPMKTKPTMPRWVLVVDDEVDIADSVAALVRSGLPESPTVSVVHSASEAIKLMADRTFDLLVADYHLGAMNGIELLHYAQRVDPGIPCILISGDANAASALANAPSVRNVEFLGTPFPPNAFINLVAAALGFAE